MKISRIDIIGQNGGDGAHYPEQQKAVWVDPPSGWMYGFPAIWNKTDFSELKDFYRHKHYPEKDLEFAVSYTRMWPVDEK